MGEFGQVAEHIGGLLSDLSERKKITAADIPEIASRASGDDEINCYPGIPGSGCHDKAIFISLSDSVYIRGKRGHLTCRQAIEKVVQHMQGTCMKHTRSAILVTDSWDATAYREWQGNIQQIKHYAHFEAYLIAGRYVSEIQL